MPSLTDVFVTVAPTTTNFGRDLSRQLRRIDASSDGRRVGDGFAGGVTGSFSKIAGGLAGAFAAVGAVDLLKGFLSDAAEAAKLTRITENTIRSMGNAAGVSAGDITKLAGSIAAKTGIDDAAIQSGQNLLLTFGNVRNEVGKGNDIFDQATRLGVDMSVALGTDASGAAIQLGKALNDPVKGITALSKAGVSFSAQQKDQIKALTASGDLLGAQKIILGELEKQFGGTAAAAADPMARLSYVAGELGESVGALLLPAVTRLAEFAGERMVPAIQSAVDVIGPKFSAAFDAVSGRVKDFRDAAEPAFAFIRDNATPIIAGLAASLGVVLVPAVTALAGTVGGALLTGFTALLSPVAVIAAAVGGLGFALTKAYEDSQPLRDGINQLREAFGLFMDAFNDADAGGGVSGFFERVGAGITAAGPTVRDALGDIAVAFWEWIKDTTGPALEQLGQWVAALGGWLRDTGLLQLKVGAAILGVALWEWVQDAVPAAVAQLGQWAGALGTWIVDTGLPLLADKARTLGAAIVGWIGENIGPALVALGGFMAAAATWVVDTGLPLLIDSLKTWGTAIWEWVGPQIPIILGELGAFLGEAVGWIVGTGLPLLVGAALKLGYELIAWVLPRIPDLLANLGSFLGSALNWVVTEGIPKLAGAMLNFGREALAGFGRAITESPLVGAIGDFFGRVADNARDRFAAGINGIKDWINDNLIGPLNAVTKLFGVTIARLATGGQVFVGSGAQRGLADGGLLRGPGTGTSDSILGIDKAGIPTARVSNGEFVVNAAQTAKHLDLLKTLNAGRLPAYAGGGIIDQVKGWLASGAEFTVKKVLDPASALISRAVPEPPLANRAATGSVGILRDALVAWTKQKDAEAARNEGPTGAAGGISALPGGGSQANLMAFAAKLISQGARASEHPAFGSVGRHATNSRHYSGRAVDFNYGPGGQNATEMAFFDKVIGSGLAKQYGLRTIWRAPGHFNHLHADYDRGGLLMPGATGANRGQRPERVLPPHETQVYDQLLEALTRQQSGGGGVFHLYDVDGTLLGTMRGAAQAEVTNTLRAVSMYQGG